MTRGDFSIIRDSSEKNYRKVLFQQGRVLTDVDFNDHVNLDDSRETTYLKDIIGKNGIPVEEKESFKITPVGGNRFTVGKGRIYVDGLLVENHKKVGNYSFLDGDVKVVGQPYVPSIEVNGQPTSEAIPTEPGKYLVHLRVSDNLITYHEDPAIQDPALGDVDTSTRVQTTWQVLLHKLESGEFPDQDHSDKNEWTPWNPLGEKDPVNNNIESDIRIGTDNKGEFLEVFSLSKLSPKHRISIRQIKSDPVEWENNWDDTANDPADDQIGTNEFDVISNHVGELDILHTFGLGGSSDKVRFNYFIRDDESRWGNKLPGPPAEFTDIDIEQIKLIMDDKKNLYAFAFTRKFLGIIYSRQDPLSLKWDVWRAAGTGNREIKIFRVILNPDTECFEVYTASENVVSWSKQKGSGSDDWTEWTGMDLDLEIEEFKVVVNRKNQVILFINDSNEQVLYSAVVKDNVDHLNWIDVGSNKPGKMIPSLGSFDVRVNTNKGGLLEVFGIFSDIASFDFGRVCNITEDSDGKWKSTWEVINKDQDLKAMNVTSAIDKKSIIHVFAVAKVEDENERRIVYHSYLKEDLMSCKFDIPSWESKIRPSTWKMKVRTVPQAPRVDDCLVPDQGGYRSLENQLYRIEIHDTKLPGKKATFKFSRDNGTIYSKITDISDGIITVASIGRDKLQRFKVGGWIEISNGLLELSGKPGVLAYIDEINGNEISYSNTIPPDAKIDSDTFPQWLKPIARQWDSFGTMDVDVPPSNEGWIDIEQGIQLKFKNVIDPTEICRTRDYHTFAARTSRRDIDWPKGEHGLPEFVPPEGIKYHYCRLAILEYTVDGNLKVLSDCRDFFNPLIDLAPSTASEPETKIATMVSWVHGTICQVEFPELLLPARPPPQGPGTINGAGSTYKQGSLDNVPFNWFHFPINITYPLDIHKKMRLQKIFVLFDSHHAQISQIDIYKGKFNVKSFKQLELSGSHSDSTTEFNTFILNEEFLIDQGIGISIKVSFLRDADFGVIDFRSVGAQFKID